MEATIRCQRCDQEIDATAPACRACGNILGKAVACVRHPDREAVGVCVVCGDAACEECDSGDDPHTLCPEHAAVPVIEGWAQIYTTADAIEADLIRENLEAEGLDAAVLSQKDRSFSVELGDLSPVRVLVPAYTFLDAMHVLISHMDGRGQVLFACPTCGEAYEVGDDVCRNCGATLPTAGHPPEPADAVSTEGPAPPQTPPAG